jgi:hypothetical protein
VSRWRERPIHSPGEAAITKVRNERRRQRRLTKDTA